MHYTGITYNLIGAPEIDAPVNGFVDKEGGMVTLNCSTLGHPAPQFIWTPSGKESVTVVGNKVISTVTLEASAAVLKDGVICEAYNKLGRATKNFKVSVKLG
ncbi:basal cell adhesion molecule-like isoform X2 [Labeo rohita]|uniref:Basal cell adhesion molecule-like isoform X2 n=1 Tax=Labeo rohita TaxID=84645 RepID=A0A498LAQ0_LABRO|nr:basal cell adhesion molecule-like isoform X2 [Labeo rohita]